ncbi:hypothetical protein WR25_09880 isoform B [Diploscapter pachys]|uniref:C-type lectin domain-containing protein n=1 Tax=Diploscapter pachys TaxID=2018661 RepID=A0A2A2LHM6_9BILA|nr:hypothetical protein WR25_09880 isoform B [Diploscapter pachys]
MDNATFLPFVCATNPIHNLTTPGPGATTPSKTCAGTLGLWDEMGICYEAIWGDAFFLKAGTRVMTLKNPVLRWDTNVICPMNFTNWANPEGVFKTYKCTSGDCCGVCYRFVNTPMPYHRAWDWCDLIEYSLVSINNAFENAFIGSAASSNLNTTGNFWIGLEKWRDGEWHWPEDIPVSYLNWANGEPKPDRFSTAFDQSTNKWITMDNSTLLPFVCASYERRNLTTPGPGATTPSKYCAGNMGYKEDMHFCYEGIWGVGWNEAHDAEQDCSALGHGAHMISIGNQAENDYVNFIFGSSGYIWIGLVGNSTTNAKWTDGRPLNFTNWANPEGVFKNYKCVSGDCCGVVSNFLSNFKLRYLLSSYIKLFLLF